MLILAIALLTPALDTSDFDQTRLEEYRGVYKEWLRLHKTSDDESHFLIDPRQNSMWIEHAGKVHDASVVALPQGCRWYAFHVSSHGVVKQSFPLRLTTPRPDIDQDSSESIFVIAISKDKAYRLSLSAHRSGNAFRWGSYSGIGDITFKMPQTPKAGMPIGFDSFLANQSPRPANPQESITTRDFTLQVVRNPIPKSAK